MQHASASAMAFGVGELEAHRLRGAVSESRRLSGGARGLRAADRCPGPRCRGMGD